jgi:hypothetical protein
MGWTNGEPPRRSPDEHHGFDTAQRMDIHQQRK